MTTRSPLADDGYGSGSSKAGSEDSGSEKGFASLPASRQSNRKRKFIIAAVLLALVVLALGLGLGLGLGRKKNNYRGAQKSKPNVLVVMADDQDMLLDSMSVMPHVNRLLGDGGVRYNKHYCTVAWCCPSRVNFFTGKAAHNTNVTSTGKPYGGWHKFAKVGLNDNYLATWINETGIGTYYVGKFLNGYGIKDLDEEHKTPAHPKGWTESNFLVDPWTYNYYNSHWSNGYTEHISGYKGVHTTDVTEDKAMNMLDSAAGSGNQFFMMVAPVAPHQEIGGHKGVRPPPIPKSWKGVFKDEKAPRRGNWNPDVPSGASWVYGSPKLTEKKIEVCDKTHRHRLANIARIDEMVNNLAQKLDKWGILDNTYIVYTSDNGFHIGNHRLLPGKRCPYEEDVNIPLLIRGPDMPKGVNSTITNSHTDMAPTFLKMLGVPARPDFDGEPIAYTKESLSNSTKKEIVTVEFWNTKGSTPLGLQSHNYYNNTYKALRMASDDYSLYYSKWCSGEREFYNMNNDFVQMNNLLGPHAQHNSSVKYYGRPQSELIERLDAVLMVTKSCKQDSCRNPWGVMFPKGEVTNLEQAMATQYDSFFQKQPKVQFEKCTPGYFPAMEKPHYIDVLGAGSQQLLMI